jgi:uncharacterized membrane protein YgaE (UPF0421/DUF939 family)
MRGRFAEATMRSSYSRIIDSVVTRFHEDEPAKVERRWVATRYGVELLTSIMILLWGYHMARAQGAVWAIITAILILQPGIDRSMSASGVIIVATLLGSSAGTVAALLVPGEAAALLAGVLVTVILCHLFRLDLHVRLACLTVPIVQTWHQGSIIHVDYERIAAILAGCGVALIVQFAGVQFRRQVSWRRTLTAQITPNEPSR